MMMAHSGANGRRSHGGGMAADSRVEPRALATEVEAEVRRSAAEPERLRTQVELKG